MGCVVVHHQMDVEVVGDLGFESAQELEELPAAVGSYGQKLVTG